MNRKIALALLPLLFFSIPSFVFGRGDREIVRQGNRLYEKGDYKGAENAYEKALPLTRRKDILEQNLGTAFYRQGDYGKASDYFLKAAQDTKREKLRAGALYNGATSLVKRAEGLTRSSPAQAKGDLERSIDLFRRSLDLRSDYTPAAYNMEIAKVMLKDLERQMKKQEQEKSQKNGKGGNTPQERQGDRGRDRKNQNDRKDRKGQSGENRQQDKNGQNGADRGQNGGETKGKEQQDEQKRASSGTAGTSPEDILREESQRQLQRAYMQDRGLYDVEKDW